MKTSHRLLLFAFLTVALNTPLLQSQTLDELRWKKRVVVMHAPAGSEKTLARQQQLFAQHASQFRERDLVQIVLRKPADHREIATRFGLADAGWTVLLLGKDGQEKLRSQKVVAPEDLLRLIDAMPMRQQKMRRRSS